MLDLQTLNIVQGSVAACAFGLVFFGTWRTTRAPFAGWWSAALAASGLSTMIPTVGGDAFPLVSAALGNAVAVLGALFTWLAARSLRQATVSMWVPTGVGVAVALGTLIERPTGAGWPGGVVLLAGMSVGVGLGAQELWFLSRKVAMGANQRTNDGEKVAAIVSMAVASTVISVFYAMRVVVYITAGPDSWFYETWAGPAMTTFMMTLVVLVVTYTVTTLSHDRVARQWRLRAMNDDLTGLFTRTAFDDRARALLRDVPSGASPVMVVADLDHFKDINDRFGHAAGDRALVRFAHAVRQTLGDDDIASRFGGEEFVFLLADVDRHQVGDVTRGIDEAFARAGAGADAPSTPTVSYGAAMWESGVDLDDLFVRADAAMYRAKAGGRARVVVDEP